MQLNGEQRKRFHKALLSAFPSVPKLRQMVSFELDDNLDAIAMGENYSDTVFELIRWAETEGKVKDLLTAARSLNSGNLELRSFEEQMRDKLDQNPKFVIPENPKIEEDELSSDIGVDYTRLRNLLQAGKWKEADEETLKVMLKAADRKNQGWLDSESIEKFPRADLRTIDQLWVKYSNERFGFSVQKRIWESIGRNYVRFGDRVGWRRGMWLDKKWLNYDERTFSQTKPQGHLPVNVWIGRGWELWDGWMDSGDHGVFLLSRQDL